MSEIVFHVADVAVVSTRCADAALWKQWALGTSLDAPEAQAPSYAVIPAGIRRRLSPLGRCALAAYAELSPTSAEPTIWASSWGDVSRTFKLTASLAEENEVSPADFALSVHNAVGAQAAIWLKNHTAASAVAAGPLTGSCALIEASLKLQTTPSVIVVRYEEPLPELWKQSNIDDTSPVPCAWAARLTADKGADVFKLKFCSDVKPTPGPHLLGEIRFLLGGTSDHEETDGQRGWKWERT